MFCFLVCLVYLCGTYDKHGKCNLFSTCERRKSAIASYQYVKYQFNTIWLIIIKKQGRNKNVILFEYSLFSFHTLSLVSFGSTKDVCRPFGAPLSPFPLVAIYLIKDIVAKRKVIHQFSFGRHHGKYTFRPN